jgi:hypothetical protein
VRAVTPGREELEVRLLRTSDPGAVGGLPDESVRKTEVQRPKRAGWRP